MRLKAIVASVVLILSAASHGAMAQGYGYGYGPPPPGYGPPPPRPGYGPPPGYGRPPGYGGGGGEVCAMENEFCNFRGYATVRYGARGRYVSRQARDGIPCSNRVFGDPAPGIPKRCIID